MNCASPYKVVVFGNGGVGKSSITLRFVTDTFTSEYIPTIEDCYRKQCIVDNRSAFIDILDTAGQEEYSALRDQWVREGNAFVLTYSVDSRASFEAITQFRERILIVNEDELVPMVLVGNKIDLEKNRQVSTAEGEHLAQELQIPFIECSALQGVNCEKVFHCSVREIRKLVKDETPKSKKYHKLLSLCNVL